MLRTALTLPRVMVVLERALIWLVNVFTLFHVELRHWVPKAQTSPPAVILPFTARLPLASRLNIGVPVPFSHTMPAPVDVAIVPLGFLDSRRSKLLPKMRSPVLRVWE